MYLLSLISRQIRRQFGGVRPFLAWVAFVTFIILMLDTFLLRQPSNSRQSPAKKTRSDVWHIGLFEGKSFLLADNADQAEKIRDKRVEPAVPDDKEEDAADKREVKNKLPEKVNPDTNCGLTRSCPDGHYAYYVSSGYGRNVSAKICFNGDELISAEQDNSHRGLNIVVINERTLNVDDIQIFDVYFTDIALMEYLRENMRDDQIFFIASQDEASYSLMTDARKALRERLGSTIISRVGFRDNYVIIGKHGLPSGSAIEALRTRESGNDHADQVSLSGCLAVPLKPGSGNIPVPAQAVDMVNKAKEAGSKERREGADNIVERKPGTENPNCGLKKSCADDEFSVQLYTGTRNKDPPKICVDGRYVLAADLNGAGRGLNFVVVNADTKEVVRVARFDTFASDNVAMEMFLELLEDNELLLAVAYDESSEKLEKPARLTLEGLGSSFIRMLDFRDVWAFVGQKGIKGFSPMEEFSPSQATKSNLQWPKPVDLKMCVPTHLKALDKRKHIRYNFKRKVFCQSYRGYGDFCNASVVDEPLWPVELSNSQLSQHPIYQVPIIVIAGITNHNAVRLQLEGLFSNPGIRVDHIMVFYIDKYKELNALAKVFDVEVSSTHVRYQELMQKAVMRSWELFPHADYMIYLDEEVIPSADFLNFFRQCFEVMTTDKSLSGISTWNPYGYTSTSKFTEIAYRADMFPGLGFLMKRTVYEQNMKNRMSACCSSWPWEGWTGASNMEMIFPEVSRVTRGRYDGQATNMIRELFNEKPRATVGPGQYSISMSSSLPASNYDNYLKSLQHKAKSLNDAGAERCLANKSYTFELSDKSSTPVYIIYYDSAKNNAVLHRLCSCFQLGPRAAFTQHRSLLRFSISGRTVLLVGSSSPFYRNKPASVNPLTPAQLKT